VYGDLSVDNLIKDFKFAGRMLAKSPVVTGAALLSLALGIGANTTIFSLVNAFLLRGLPVADPETLVTVYTTEERQARGNFMPVSRPNYHDLRDQTELFEQLADVLFTGADMVAEGGEPEQVGIQLVTGNYFTTLGVSAQLGRVFVDEGKDEVPGAEPYVILSHAFWTQRFGADPEILGRTLKLNGTSFTVVGVAPPGFQGTFTLGGPSLWTPVSMREPFLTGFMADYFDHRRALLSFVVGRLRPGVSPETGNAALATLGARLQEQYPADNEGRSFAMAPLQQTALGGPDQRSDFFQAGGLLMAVVGLVLLIACANVANLLLGRAASRRKELGIRVALGATRASLVRQLLAESLLMAVAAGVLGLAFAFWARGALWSARPPFLAQAELDLGFDPRVLFFTLAVTLATGVLFGLAPAIRSSRPSIVRELTQTADSASGAGRVLSFRNLLVMGQVTLSLVALIGSGLFLRSLGEAMKVDIGYEPEKLLSLNLDLGRAGYDEARGAAFFDRVLERVRSVPGVEAAVFTTQMPLSGGGFQRSVFVEGRDPTAENNGILVPVNETDSGFAETFGVRLLRGRNLEEGDRAGSTAVVLVNEAMAERFWPDEEALGERFHFHGQEDTVREVVGILRDTKYLTLGEEPQPQVYVPRKQAYTPAMTLAVRAAGDPEALTEVLRAAVRELDPNLPITGVTTGVGAIEQGLWPAEMGAWLLGILGGLALLLAAIGIYGVTAYTVSQRNRELSVRMALGASRMDILDLVIQQGLKVVAVGLVLGLGLAALVGQRIENLLYGVSGVDARTFFATALTLLGVAFVANLFPAIRATSVDPVKALRFER
jgi:putative ABC transport system permease protein